MKSQLKLKKWLAAILSSALLAASVVGCGGSDDDKVTGGGTDFDPGTPDACLLALGDPDLKSSAVEDACEGAGDQYELLSEIRLLVDSLSSVLSIISSGLGSPAYTPALDVRALVESALSKILKRLQRVEELSNKIKANDYDDIAVVVESMPLDIDISVIDSDLPKIEMDMKGEWTRIPFSVAGMGASGVLALLNYVLGHEIDIDIDEISDLIDDLGSVSIASFIANSPDLLAAANNGKFEKVAPSAKIFLSLIAGSEGGAQGLAGLLAMADEQIAKDTDTSDTLIALIDDGDKKMGKGDTIAIQFLNDAIQNIDLSDIDAIDDVAEFKKDFGRITNTYISRTTLEDAQKLGWAINANVLGGAAVVDLSKYLDGAVADLRAYLKSENINVEFKAPEAWLALDPKQVLNNITPIRDFLPLIYAIDVAPGDTSGEYKRLSDNSKIWDGTAATDVVNDPKEVKWEFLLECEVAFTADEWAVTEDTGAVKTLKEDDSITRHICGVGDDKNSGKLTHKPISFGDNGALADSGHFIGQVVSAPTAATTTPVLSTVDQYVFAKGMKGLTASITADDKVPAGTADKDVQFLPYIGLQDPSITGLLQVDPEGKGNFAVADHKSFNATLAEIMLSYVPPILEALE